MAINAPELWPVQPKRGGVNIRCAMQHGMTIRQGARQRSKAQSWRSCIRTSVTTSNASPIAERRAPAQHRRMRPARRGSFPVSRQCRLLAISRSSVDRRPAEVSEEDCAIMALIDRQYLARPYYGSRRMAAWLATQGHVVSRKRVRRLMRSPDWWRSSSDRTRASRRWPTRSTPTCSMGFRSSGVNLEQPSRESGCSDLARIIHRAA